MSAALEPGMWVGCASLHCGCADVTPVDVGLFLSVGTAYRLTRVGHSADGAEAVEIADWPDTPFCPGHFRPLYTPDGSLIRSLQQPVPAETVEA